MTDLPTLYEQDFIAWSKEQAEALRAAGRAGANLPLDWENLAEEVETLGASERRALHSQVQRIVRHLLKLEHSQATGPRPGWAETVNDARSEIELVFEMSPSLEREVGHVVDVERPRGARGAIKDLQKYGELDRATETALRSSRYSAEQILGDWFPPEPVPPRGR
jgi:uncharacterized protein DUF29